MSRYVLIAVRISNSFRPKYLWLNFRHLEEAESGIFWVLRVLEYIVDTSSKYTNGQSFVKHRYICWSTFEY